jgi:hypothetical protein
MCAKLQTKLGDSVSGDLAFGVFACVGLVLEWFLVGVIEGVVAVR